MASDELIFESEEIPAQVGTYLLIFEARRRATPRVGRLGSLTLDPGYYFYIGSAFGPGGLRARVKHHSGISTKPHWHLDYIRPSLSLREVWYSIDAVRYEHVWAAVLGDALQMHIPLPGLGASDCRCESHFFYAKDKPGRQALRAALQKNNNMSLMVQD